MKNTDISLKSKNAIVLSVVSTKGGVGKTTTAANLGALVADTGKKVLLIDLDIQPTLSSYFKLSEEKQQGTYELIGSNNKNLDEIVSKTNIDNLDIILSNDYENQLNRLLTDSTGGGRVRLYNLLPYIKPHYDLIVIDTQGARSAILEMAIIASDLAISPLPPEMLAAREFGRGTVQLASELIATYSVFNISIPQIQLFINRADFSSVDSQSIAEGLRESYKENEYVNVLDTYIPSIAAYRKAATIGEAAHRYETKKPQGRVAPAALESLKSLALEIFPEWQTDFDKLTPELIKTLSQKDTLQIA